MTPPPISRPLPDQPVPDEPLRDQSDAEGSIIVKVAEALRGIRFGEVVVVVVNGQVDRIDRVQKSRPYRAPRENRS